MRAIYSLCTINGPAGYRNYEELLESLSLTSMISFLHFDSVVLYCDSHAYDLINTSKLSFGFTEILPIIPGDLFKNNSSEWALTKLYVYSLQEEPFVHLDVDLMLWDGLPDEAENARFIFQNLESFEYEMYSFYRGIYEDLEKLGILPKFSNKEDYAYNMGIFAVLQKEDVPLMKEYYQNALNYLEDFRKLSKIPKSLSKYGVNCCVFEQCFIVSLLNNYCVKQSDILCILNKDLSKAINNYNYSHFAVTNKQDPNVVNHIRRFLPVYRSRYVSKRASQILSLG